MKQNLVSDGQGREVARLARGVGLSRAELQQAITDGTIEGFLRELKLNPLGYPDGIVHHLTPRLEVETVRDPGQMQSWLHPRQRGKSEPHGVQGQEIYCTMKRNCLLERSLSLGELRFLEANPTHLAPRWYQRGLSIFGWASVVKHESGKLFVPCIQCHSDRPIVCWRYVDRLFSQEMPAGLHVA